jgi:hypothetical protein
MNGLSPAARGTAPLDLDQVRASMTAPGTMLPAAAYLSRDVLAF